jgi:hypothetical protein
MVIKLPLLSMLAIVVAPYLKTNLPPTSEMLKFVVCSSGVLLAVVAVVAVVAVAALPVVF